MADAADDRPWLAPPLAAMARPLGGVYARVVEWRRRRMQRSARRRRLRRPVISIGNLAVGGSGKTPVVAHLAALLRDAGEYPAILSRGYARRRPADGVVVVRAATGVRATLDRAGDEPLMLARLLPGCAVLAAADRHLAGVLAESRLGCSVHVLDDGFQHLSLARDLDLLVVSAQDLEQELVLPAGRLREAPWTAGLADAWIADSRELEDVRRLADRFGVGRVFGATRALASPVPIDLAGGTEAGRQAPVLLVSGIGRPARFERDVRAAGWQVSDHVVFADHHRYRRRDVEAIATRMRSCGAAAALTTGKDAVRLESLRPLPCPMFEVPLVVRVEPPEEFRAWLLEALARRRRSQGAAAGLGS